jgi:hypothetical protein
MNNHFETKYKIIWPIAVALLTLVVAYVVFGVYLYAPNKHISSAVGDGLVIYYDVFYHACYGKGTMLTGMNYPHGEYIFLTDAQGAVSMVLQWINRYLFDVCDCIPGIMHALNIFLLPFSSLFLFYILKYLNVNNLIALLFSILITFLSPQMLRFSVHFGLAYPFVIPMAIWWFLRKYQSKRLEWFDLLVLATLLFFTYNNPYVGFASAGLLLVGGFVSACANFRNKPALNTSLLIMAVGLLAVAIPFIDFKLHDPVSDRIQQQWGYFFYHAALKGILYPPDSLIHTFLGQWLKMPPIQFESMMNIGLVCLFLSIGLLWHLLTKRKSENRVKFPAAFAILAAAATIIFFYADSSLFKIDKDWSEDHLGFLLMFKASGRLAWSSYYIITLACVVYFDWLLKRINKTFLYYFLLAGASAVWFYEIIQYGASRYKANQYENILLPSMRQNMLDILENNKIDISQFQSMLLLPRTMAWSDNFISNLHWETQYYGLHLSASTGLPMINAMLSRMSIGQTAEAIQMLANPLIVRDRLAHFPNEKDILLLLGGKHPPLGTGEQFLIDIATPLYKSDEFSLFRLKLADINNNQYIEAAKAYYLQNKVQGNDFIHHAYDGETSPDSFYGKGAKALQKGETAVFDEILPVEKDTQYIFSAWVKIDPEKYGVAEWKLFASDSLGQTYFEGRIETRRSNDIQDGWIRAELTFPAKKGARLKAVADCNRVQYIDELLVYPAGGKVVIDLPDSDEFMLNGYKIKKPGH